MSYEQKLEMLLELGRVISKEANINKLLETISHSANEITSSERCSIFIYDEKDDSVWTRVAHGIEQIKFPASQGLVGAAIKTGEVQVVSNASSDLRFFNEIDKSTGYETKTLLVIPLFDKHEQILGAIELINKKDGVFDNFDIKLMVLLGNYVSTTLENALLNKKVLETNTKIIYKLSTAAEFKDDETSAHTKRVAFYSEIIARECDMSDEDIEYIFLTAPMHDVGKIGIPDAIIQKPEKLSTDEFTCMKQHTTIGEQLLHDSESKLLEKAALVARDHHEKWNGTGYPNALKGEQISLEGRIVAIADVFDALTSKRPYKEPWNFNAAVKYLEDNKGEHFDPTLVEYFIKNIKQVTKIYHNYKED